MSSRGQGEILRLPPEILEQCFIWSLPFFDASEDWLTKSPFNPIYSPLLLTEVCKSWNTTALNSSKLWSYIVIDESSTQMTSRVLAYLERSRGTSLTIAFNECAGDDGFIVALRDTRWSLADSDPTFVAVLAECRRWGHLELRLTHESHLDLFEPCRGYVPQLQYLSISTIPDTPGYAHAIARPSFRAFEDAPALRWVNLGVAAELPHYPLPWNQLLTLKISSVLENLHILNNASRLEVLQISIRGGMSPFPTEVTLPRLHTLKFSFDTIGSLQPRSNPLISLFKRLILPNLRNFTITFHPIAPWPLEESKIFFSRVRRTLRSFVIRHPTITCDEILQILGLLEGIQRLQISAPGGIYLSNSFCNALSLPKGILPCLKDLALRITKGDGLSSMLRSRSRLAVATYGAGDKTGAGTLTFLPLERLSLTFYSTGHQKDVLEVIRHLRRTGTSIEISGDGIEDMSGSEEEDEKI